MAFPPRTISLGISRSASPLFFSLFSFLSAAKLCRAPPTQRARFEADGEGRESFDPDPANFLITRLQASGNTLFERYPARNFAPSRLVFFAGV